MQKLKITLSLFNAKSAVNRAVLRYVLASCKSFVGAESARRMRNTLAATTDMHRKLARSQEVKQPEADCANACKWRLHATLLRRLWLAAAAWVGAEA